ncbi:type II toxin-antitoxin system VapC family toxin [Desulfatiferula olefinivorans]
MTIFDTDIFIWAQRGNEKAVAVMETAEERHLSIQTYMELLQCAQNKNQHAHIKNFLSAFDFFVLPLTENIGHRASIYIEEYAQGSGLRSGDAIIAATAVENNLPLMTSNVKHFRIIKDLSLIPFTP